MNDLGEAAKELLVDHRDHVAVVTLNRPASLNALNGALAKAVVATMDALRTDDNVRVVVITGAGRAFCSGGDVKGGGWPLPRTDQTSRLDELGWVGRQAKAIFGLDKPTIAAVNGIAVGAGMSLALACDVRIGGTSAAFRTMFLERGLSPDAGMTYFLTRILGYSRAAELVFTTRTVTAAEAVQVGLLNRVVQDDDLMLAAVELATEMAQLPPLALRASKRVLQHNLECTLDEALLYERAGLRLVALAPEDRREAMQSLREKRSPKFTGN